MRGKPRGNFATQAMALEPLRACRHASHPDLGGGADVAQAAREEALSMTAMTEEVSK